MPCLFLDIYNCMLPNVTLNGISVTKSKSWIFHEIIYTHNPKWLSYCQLMVSNATIFMNTRICSFTNISANKNESGASTCVCSCYYISHKTWLYSYKCERVVLQKFSWYKTFHLSCISLQCDIELSR